MNYHSIFKELEKARWKLTSDIKWDAFKPELLDDEQLSSIKMNAILEWSSLPTAKMFLNVGSDQMDFSAFMSIWFYEEQKHSFILMEYLKRFAPNYVPTEQELSNVCFDFDNAPLSEALILNYCGEVRLSQWYRCAQNYYKEPVIKSIYKLIEKDEIRHAKAYLTYMQELIKNDERVKETFIKISLLMLNSKVKKAMHPTNLHVNKKLYPNDTVNGRLPDPEWIELWLNNLILFDEIWESKVELKILRGLSKVLNIKNLTKDKLKKIYMKVKGN